MLDKEDIRRAIPRWLEEAKALARGSKEQAKLVQLIRDAIAIVEEEELQEHLIKQAQLGI